MLFVCLFVCFDAVSFIAGTFHLLPQDALPADLVNQFLFLQVDCHVVFVCLFVCCSHCLFTSASPHLSFSLFVVCFILFSFIFLSAFACRAQVQRPQRLAARRGHLGSVRTALAVVRCPCCSFLLFSSFFFSVVVILVSFSQSLVCGLTSLFVRFGPMGRRADWVKTVRETMTHAYFFGDVDSKEAEKALSGRKKVGCHVVVVVLIFLCF
jgi:hypothetical protein